MVKRASRLNSRELKYIKSFLMGKYGSICQMDKKEYPMRKLVVDHIDNNPLNNEESNLQLLCQSCNISKNPPYKIINKDVDNFSLGGSEDVIGSESGYENNSTPFGMNSYPVWKRLKSEPIFRNWLEENMRIKLTMLVEQVINDGANIADCSTKTARTYLNKLVYDTGPYYIYEDDKTGVEYLKWKNEFFPYKENGKNSKISPKP